MPALAGVLLHRLVDEVVDAAFELARHLLERLPEHVPALKAASALLVWIRAHRITLQTVTPLSRSAQASSEAGRQARPAQLQGVTIEGTMHSRANSPTV